MPEAEAVLTFILKCESLQILHVSYSTVNVKVKVKVKVKVRVKVKQSHYRPGGFQEVTAPIFHDNGTGWW
jgi:hypothetical protein